MKYLFNSLTCIISNKLQETKEIIEAFTKNNPKKWELNLNEIISKESLLSEEKEKV